MASRFLAPLPTRGWLPEPLFQLQREIDRVFDDVFSASAGGGGSRSSSSMALTPPRIDVKDSENELCVHADMPGVSANDLDVRVEGDVLTIRGERKSENERSEQNYHVMERSHGRFQRSLQLPFAPDPQQVQASMRDGVLEVHIPKRSQQERSRRIQVRDAGAGGASAIGNNGGSGSDGAGASGGSSAPGGLSSSSFGGTGSSSSSATDPGSSSGLGIASASSGGSAGGGARGSDDGSSSGTGSTGSGGGAGSTGSSSGAGSTGSTSGAGISGQGSDGSGGATGTGQGPGGPSSVAPGVGGGPAGGGLAGAVGGPTAVPVNEGSRSSTADSGSR